MIIIIIIKLNLYFPYDPTVILFQEKLKHNVDTQNCMQILLCLYAL